MLTRKDYRVNWIPMDLENSWVPYDTGLHHQPEYTRLPNGFVYLRGLVKSGSISYVNRLTNLPIGYRPARRILLPTASNFAFGEIVIEPSGDVFAGTGSNSYFSLHVSFDTRP